MYVKFSGKGEWKELNDGYQLRTAAEYAQTFYVGSFNGNLITDVLRISKGKFLVYWNGKGDFRELSSPGLDLARGTLLFANNLTQPRTTDVIHVDNRTNQWTILSGGKAGPTGIRTKFAQPLKVRFGNLDGDALWEPFGIELRSEPLPPTETRMQVVAKATRAPGVVTRYVPARCGAATALRG